ncbi:MAG: 4-hydroxybenzoate octaprenyltransferase [Rhodospirillales bacterium]|nr:4-hydroxybenzoate octaprenyltransferase [Rhodospirillales bacterium]
MNEAAKPSASDIPSGNWVDRLLPDGLKPYARLSRLDRPIGTWLLLLPGWWSLALATPGWPDPGLVVLFGIGAIVMRGAGCVHNDITDRDFDKMVARTADRPIASGAVSLPRAFAFMGLLALIGFAVLWQFNLFAVWVGAASLLLVAVYPFMKRITYWPQAVLGLTFNWGALLGWAAVRGEIAPAALVLYAAGFFWTLGYDTIYAHQDKEDDLLVGIKSTALRLGDATRPWLFVFYGISLVLLAWAGILAGLGWPFYAGLALAAGHLAWQAATIDTDTAADCLAKFKSNRDYGLILFAAIIAGQLIR